MQALLSKKRRGGGLSTDEIDDFVRMVSDGRAHDSQIGAMLMAICIQGMTDKETADLTSSMVKSGRQLTWPGVVGDKHSTGGVGDKVSIPLAPILAQLGLIVPMISGRGLEITGGTLDKLESIPGYRADLGREEMSACLESCGCFIAAATRDICPADKKTYVIRDVTSTVDYTPLVTASILSKKIAEGAKYLIQDIKVGEAAFYKNVKSAEELAKSMIDTAKLSGLKMAASLTRMDQPIGRAVGNSLEIQESIDILRGTHHPRDLMELILELGGQLLVLAELYSNVEEAKASMKTAIQNGSALKKFECMLKHQGVKESDARELCHGDVSKVLKQSAFTTPFKAEEEGYVESINALKVGTVCFKLGSGRNVPTDNIDHSVGCIISKSRGDRVSKDETWATLHHNKPLPEELIQKMKSAIKVTAQPCTYQSIIIKTVNGH